MVTLNPFNDDVQVNTRKAFRAELAQIGCHCSWNQLTVGFTGGGAGPWSGPSPAGRASQSGRSGAWPGLGSCRSEAWPERWSCRSQAWSAPRCWRWRAWPAPAAWRPRPGPSPPGAGSWPCCPPRKSCGRERIVLLITAADFYWAKDQWS